MLTLHGHLNTLSVNTFKIRVALAEAGARYTYVPVDLAAGAQRRPEFLKLNPHGKVPVLVDDDFVLPESDAILWYVAESFPAAELVGSSRRDRARTLQWLDFTATALYPGYYETYLHTSHNPPERRIHAVAEAAKERLRRAMKTLEAVLSTRHTLASAFSIADIAAASVLRAMHERIPNAASGYPHTQAWYERVTARPAWRNALATTQAK